MKLFIDSLWISPYAYSVYSALREMEILFHLKEVRFEKSHSLTPSFQGRTFTDLIPAIEDKGFFLSESLAILEYLHEKDSKPGTSSLFPRNLKDRAQARMLLSWYRCGFQALRRERSTETVFYPSDPRTAQTLSAEAVEEVDDWKHCLTSLLKPGNPFLFGEWSIVDTETALMLQRLIKNGDPVENHLKTYAESVWNRPPSREFILHAREPFQSYSG